MITPEGAGMRDQSPQSARAWHSCKILGSLIVELDIPDI
jgi:hypothetical protein